MCCICAHIAFKPPSENERDSAINFQADAVNTNLNKQYLLLIGLVSATKSVRIHEIYSAQLNWSYVCVCCDARYHSKKLLSEIPKHTLRRGRCKFYGENTGKHAESLSFLAQTTKNKMKSNERGYI